MHTHAATGVCPPFFGEPTLQVKPADCALKFVEFAKAHALRSAISFGKDVEVLRHFWLIFSLRFNPLMNRCAQTYLIK